MPNSNASVIDPIRTYVDKAFSYAPALDMVWVDSHLQAMIRISTNSGGSWSFIGKDAMAISRHSPTINFGWFDNSTPDEEYERTVVHEVFHSLGCIHEHQNPAGGIQWNREVVYEYYKSGFGWDQRMVDENIFEVYDQEMTMYTEFDPDSIMCYPIPKEFTTNGFEVGWNTTPSPRDIEFLAEVYK